MSFIQLMVSKMRKKIQRTLISATIFVCMILLSSCALNNTKISPQVQLENEINKWQSFHMEGMAEISISSFVIRKYFICQKYTHSVQFDLVNSGLLGAEPAPFVSIKVDSLLTIESPYRDMIQSMFNRSGFKQSNLSHYLDFKTVLKDKMPEIVSTGKTTIGTFEFRFFKNMQLSQIISQDKKQNIMIQYRNNEPSVINIEINKLGNIRMQVEQFVNTSCCDSLATLPAEVR